MEWPRVGREVLLVKRSRCIASLVTIVLGLASLPWAASADVAAPGGAGSSGSPGAKEVKKGSKTKGSKDQQRPPIPAPSPPGAGQSASPAASGGDEPLLFTNEDLDRMFGSSAGATAEPAGEGASGDAAKRAEEPGKTVPADDAARPEVLPDPLQAIQDEKRRSEQRQAQIALTEKAVADAEANVRDLEARLLAQRNPFLARPKLSKEDADAERDLDANQRVQRTEQQLEESRRDLERARAELARLRSGS